MISVEHVSKSFGTRQILRDVSLSVGKGETMVILGASGSGKSTLLKMIIGLLRPDSGRVMVNGQDITRMNEDELNRERIHMGMVFQYSALFDSMSVRGNVAFGLRQHGHFSEEEIDSIVREKTSPGRIGWYRIPYAGQFVRRHEKKGKSGQGHRAESGNYPV